MSIQNIYEQHGLPEWMVLPDRPDLGHHPNPHQPSHTRCGLALVDATAEPRPRNGCTACLPVGSADPDRDGLDDLWNGGIA